MTPGTILLAIAAGWIGLAVFLGKTVRRRGGKRWHQVVVTALVIWLPLWDVIPGYVLYRKAIREIAGVRIHRTVDVEGYLDLTRSAAFTRTAWEGLRWTPYRYVEVRVEGHDKSGYNPLAVEPGYYEFRLARRGRPECKEFESLPYVADIRARHSMADWCVVATRRDEPMSRYQLTSEGDWFPKHGPFRPVSTGCIRARDRLANEVIAEACQVRFRSWLAHRIGVPVWVHDTTPEGRPSYFDHKNVLRPIQTASSTGSSNSGP